MTELYFDEISSAIGTIVIISDGTALCALDFESCKERTQQLLEKRFGKFTLTRQPNVNGFSDRIRAYLEGDLTSLEQIPVNTGGTPFQQQVWSTLRTIPAGKVMSYGEVAQKIGRPTASRAVGMANSQNPVALVLPCHRVIGSNSKLTGYAGGLDRKEWLLKHEGAL